MLSVNNITDLFSFKQFVSSTCVSDEQENIIPQFESQRDTSSVRCPLCNGKVHVHDTSRSTLKDMPFLPGAAQKINVLVHRYKCQSCSCTFNEEVEFKYPGTRVTKRAAAWIKAFLLCRMSIKSVSTLTGIHWDTISKIHKEIMDSELKKRKEELLSSGYKPKRLAVDEFAIHKGHTYATCVMDIDEGDVLWVGKGRSIADFSAFFDEIDPEYLSEIEAVAMDMNASYNKLVEKNLPHAEIVYDRYHMQAQFGKDVLGAVRLEEAKRHKQEAEELKASISTDMTKEELREMKEQEKEARHMYSVLKSSRWQLLKNSSNLNEKSEMKLQSILETHSDLAVCYAMKEEMSRLFELRDPERAEKGWHVWFEAAKASGIPQLEKFARIKEKRIPGLVAHAKHHISTGKLEGFNNKIKVAKRIGYGYRDDDYFFTLIRYSALPSSRRADKKALQLHICDLPFALN